MAPARMMQFVDQHVKGCRTCQADLLLPEEVEKVRDFILPEAKLPKTARASDESSTPEISPNEDDEMDEDNEFSDDSDEDLDDPLDDEDNLSEDDII